MHDSNVDTTNRKFVSVEVNSGSYRKPRRKLYCIMYNWPWLTFMGN